MQFTTYFVSLPALDFLRNICYRPRKFKYVIEIESRLFYSHKKICTTSLNVTDDDV